MDFNIMVFKKRAHVYLTGKNILFFTVFLIMVLLIFTSYYRLEEKDLREDSSSTETCTERPEKYLINTSACKIPDADPYGKDVLPFVSKKNYFRCTNLPLLAYVEKTGDNIVIVRINETVISRYSRLAINCCVESVSRKGECDINYSNCKKFVSQIQVNHTIFQVTCTNFFKTVFQNTYAKLTKNAVQKILADRNTNIINEKDNNIEIEGYDTNKKSFNFFNSMDLFGLHLSEKANEKSNNKARKDESKLDDKINTINNQEEAQETMPKFNVILIGIDSISKQNLQRTMPKSFKFLEENYVSLRGYNKIGENTFPNLIAILTGRSMENVTLTCNTDLQIDSCDFIWKEFRKSAYITAYVEDEIEISTFNYRKPGFRDPPTDVYYRPYLLASHRLPVKKIMGLSTCTGPENSGERVFNSVLDFVTTFRNYPNFGLFWTNSFSHDSINLPSSMDQKIEEFLKNKEFLDATRNNTFVVFFSDHGFRFGNIRFTYTGWLEERLPYIYFKMPQTFGKMYPKLKRNFLANARTRLTSPYDFFMTLQEILHISDKSYRVRPSIGCPQSRSLFHVVPEDRTCEDGCINQHWCTCHGHLHVSTKLKIVQKAAQFLTQEINRLIQKYPQEGHKCSKYTLDSISTAGVSKKDQKGQNIQEFLILFQTYPLAMYESTVQVTKNNKTDWKFEVLGVIERLNKYATNSYCVDNAILKKYCYCDEGLVNTIKFYMCKLFNC